jgi:hypothetical protein
MRVPLASEAYYGYLLVAYSFKIGVLVVVDLHLSSTLQFFLIFLIIKVNVLERLLAIKQQLVLACLGVPAIAI